MSFFSLLPFHFTWISITTQNGSKVLEKELSVPSLCSHLYFFLLLQLYCAPVSFYSEMRGIFFTRVFELLFPLPRMLFPQVCTSLIPCFNGPPEGPSPTTLFQVCCSRPAVSHSHFMSDHPVLYLYVNYHYLKLYFKEQVYALYYVASCEYFGLLLYS